MRVGRREHRIFKEEGIVENARKLGADVIGPGLRELAEKHPSVGEVRGLGVFWAIELVRDRETREPLVPFNAAGAAAEPMVEFAAACKAAGLWPFAHFNRTHVVPPCTTTADEIARGPGCSTERSRSPTGSPPDAVLPTTSRRCAASSPRRARALWARRAVRAELAQRPPVPDGTVEIAVYFTDGRRTSTRSTSGSSRCAGCTSDTTSPCFRATGSHAASCCSVSPVPVHHAPERRRARGVHRAAADPGRPLRQPEQRNFSAMRFADPSHVFICHGESDKVYMSSTVKAYDCVFIAGRPR